MKYLRIPLPADQYMDFSYIPGGGFLMGTDYDEYDLSSDVDESPQRIQNLHDFLIGKFPVTNQQYQIFVQQTGYKKPNHFQNGISPVGKEKHPVTNVNLMDAINFSNWMRDISNYLICLPSESQWEKSARGINGQLYPWGNANPDDTLSNFRKFYNGTTEVGLLPKGSSPYGVYDMAGNVWEWTISNYESYPGNTTILTSIYGSKSFVIRGGSYGSFSNGIRCSNRESYDCERMEEHIGFRCACLLKS